MIVLLFAIVLAVAAASGLAAVLLARRHAWRWGEIPGTAVAAGEGAYRRAVLATSAPRATPAVVTWAAGTGFAWAALTFFVFAPAGLLLALGLAIDGDLAAAVPWILALSVSGFALSVVLGVAGLDLLRCRPGAQQRARRVAMWALGHHLAVDTTMTLLAIAHAFGLARSDWSFLLGATLPCIVGAIQALLLHAAGSVPGPAIVHADPS